MTMRRFVPHNPWDWSLSFRPNFCRDGRTVHASLTPVQSIGLTETGQQLTIEAPIRAPDASR
ncbi:hypothetical protein J2D73_09485 [Acetobacter sacchari]|uniref:Uncharacterized protein n=1 Tax=Acetobacter sacchari TaxID=2661687 RepID=A0ABS3LVT4_9PROT|nr:hypothetical protein [Acetobacter sacchari]MBO1360026.1 hypothetical protein [Acetobacter sacchari]